MYLKRIDWNKKASLIRRRSGYDILLYHNPDNCIYSVYQAKSQHLLPKGGLDTWQNTKKI